MERLHKVLRLEIVVAETKGIFHNHISRVRIPHSSQINDLVGILVWSKLVTCVLDLCLHKVFAFVDGLSREAVAKSVRIKADKVVKYYGLKALRRNLWCVASHVLKTDVSLPNLGLNHGFLTDFGFLLKRVS